MCDVVLLWYDLIFMYSWGAQI